MADIKNEMRKRMEEAEQSNGIKNEMEKFIEKITPQDKISRLEDFVEGMEIQLDELPSKGLFYPDDTKIKVRAATVKEIRAYSSMLDPEERTDIHPFLAMKDQNDKTSDILNKCCIVTMNGQRTNQKDLVDSDRFYLLFVIREVTFKNKPSRITMNIECPETGAIDRVELKPDVFSFLKPKDELMKYYSTTEKCFVINSNLIGELKLYAPTVGTINKLLDVQANRLKTDQKVDETIFILLPNLFDDWRKINDTSIKKLTEEVDKWSLEKWSVATQLSKMINEDMGVSPEITHKHSASDVEVRKTMDFRLKNLFLPGNILAEI
jgi:hypothetical protein